ncbi:MAG: ATP-binding cassette domain-containing protein [Actinobacteria bacterium]|nr:ATP-binding cassette domain-containing protein [Actinomycetota bacterium]
MNRVATAGEMRSPETLSIDVRVEVRDFGVNACFAARAGCTALIGPSGSGKSLTLAAVAGTIRPIRGTIRCGDVVFADARGGESAHVHLPSQDRGIGMVFQHAALLEHLSPLDNVALAVRSGDRATRQREAATLLERVGAATRSSARTRTLSGGERQRVALARALAGNPRILLLDEPFSRRSRACAWRASDRASPRQTHARAGWSSPPPRETPTCRRPVPSRRSPSPTTPGSLRNSWGDG